ncbi:calcitonin gene-related peptide-like isoform X2 [Arapaima gigas]
MPPLSRSSVTAQKRACNTATCVTHRLADFLSRSGGIGSSNFVPTNVGAKAFGRRRRSTQMAAFTLTRRHRIHVRANEEKRPSY